MLKKSFVLFFLISLAIPAIVYAKAYLIAMDEELLRTPNLAGDHSGPPLPVVKELEAYFGAKVDVVGISLKQSRPLSRYLSAGYDLIIMLGPEASEVGHVAAKGYYRQNFALIDCDRTTSLADNVMGFRFSGPLGAYLAGYIAAKMSQRGHIAFIGGWRTNSILDLAKAYKQGALEADPKVNVRVAYINDFYSHRAGLAQANEFFNAKTDVIFHAAGFSGAGILEAAQRSQKWTIGINTDFYAKLDRNNMLTSVTLDYNMAIMEACLAVESGSFAGGTSTLMTLANYGVGLGDTRNIPPAIMLEVENIRAELISGKLKIRNSNGKIIR